MMLPVDRETFWHIVEQRDADAVGSLGGRIHYEGPAGCVGDIEKRADGSITYRIAAAYLAPEVHP